MKHQLFKKNTYVRINVGKSHLTIIGKVKNSKIEINSIRAEEIFNIPQQSIEIKTELLILQENSKLAPQFIDDLSFIREIIKDFDGIVIKEEKLFVAIEDLRIPDNKLKQLYYKLNQGAKSNQR